MSVKPTAACIEPMNPPWQEIFRETFQPSERIPGRIGARPVPGRSSFDREPPLKFSAAATNGHAAGGGMCLAPGARVSRPAASEKAKKVRPYSCAVGQGKLLRLWSGHPLFEWATHGRNVLDGDAVDGMLGSSGGRRAMTVDSMVPACPFWSLVPRFRLHHW